MARPANPVVAIAGSRALPSGLAPRALVRFLAALPLGAKVLLRSGLATPTGRFEVQTANLCDLLGLQFELRRPYPEWIEETQTWIGGREATFARDLKLISDMDLLLAFYSTAQVGDETSGTVALVEKALHAEKIVYAYAFDGLVLERVGEHDPDNEWGDLVPATF